MSTALIGTRKGLFTLTVDDGTFDLSPPAFPGVADQLTCLKSAVPI